MSEKSNPFEDALKNAENIAKKETEKKVSYLELTEEDIKAAFITNEDDVFAKFEKNMRGVFLKRLNNAMLTVPDAKFLTLFGKYAEYILPKKTRIENNDDGDIRTINVIVKKQVNYDDELLDVILNNSIEDND